MKYLQTIKVLLPTYSDFAEVEKEGYIQYWIGEVDKKDDAAAIAQFSTNGRKVLSIDYEELHENI